MSRTSVTTAALCLVSTLLTAACDSTSEPKIGPPTVIVPLSGSAQTGAVATALGAPIVVRVNDSNGNAVPNTPISWSTPDGGTLTGAATTDASGTAQATWTLGTTRGTQTAVATVASIPPLNITATATAGPPSQVQKNTGDAQTGAAGTSLVSRPAIKV